jgi:hypothetical protein
MEAYAAAQIGTTPHSGRPKKLILIYLSGLPASFIASTEP